MINFSCLIPGENYSAFSTKVLITNDSELFLQCIICNLTVLILMNVINTKYPVVTAFLDLSVNLSLLLFSSLYYRLYF